MNKTNHRDPDSICQKAQVEESPAAVTETDSLEPNPRSIVTSRTEGDIEVIIVNKPQPTKDMDNLTS